MHALVVKAVVGLAAASGAVTGLQASSTGHAAVQANTAVEQAQAVTSSYVVQSGDTLYNIAARFCGNGADYPRLAAASGIANPNIIYKGQRIVLACNGASSSGSAQAAEREPDGDADDTTTTGSVAANGQANIPGTVPSVYSYFGLEQLWSAAGGAYGERGVAACIAEAESGGRVWATGAHGERGLWQISPGHGSLSSYDPYINAQAAVAISANGRNWSAWTTAGRCGA
jgi:LysM repeat protein